MAKAKKTKAPRARLNKALLKANPAPPVPPAVQLKPLQGGAPALVTTQDGRQLLAYPAGDDRATCRASKSSGRLRPCHVELDFFGPDQARRLGLPGSGPALRLCTGKINAPGYLIPVQSPRQAAQLAREFCSCAKGKRSGRDRGTCALKLKLRNRAYTAMGELAERRERAFGNFGWSR